MGGVAVELAYHPRVTPLLKLVEEANHIVKTEGKDRETRVPWIGIEGCEILLEQGYEQFRLWTGRRPPKNQVREAVLEAFEQQVRDGLA